MIKFSIRLSIYKTTIDVIIGGTEDERKEFLLKFYDYNNVMYIIEETQCHDATTVLHHKTGDIIIMMNESPKTSNFWMSILVHETSHATRKILGAIDTPHIEETEEVYAYLQQYIFEEILNTLDNGQSA
jgi:hypothetical protein